MHVYRIGLKLFFFFSPYKVSQAEIFWTVPRTLLIFCKYCYMFRCICIIFRDFYCRVLLKLQIIKLLKLQFNNSSNFFMIKSVYVNKMWKSSGGCLYNLDSTVLVFRLPENYADALKHVRILTKYFNIYIYIWC